MSDVILFLGWFGNVFLSEPKFSLVYDPTSIQIKICENKLKISKGLIFWPKNQPKQNRNWRKKSELIEDWGRTLIPKFCKIFGNTLIMPCVPIGPGKRVYRPTVVVNVKS